MAERPAALPVLAAARPRFDLLLALAVAIEMQVEISLADAPRSDVLVGRGALLGLAAAVAVRRRQPVLAAALGSAASPWWSGSARPLATA
jgi:hypothetical protein